MSQTIEELKTAATIAKIRYQTAKQEFEVATDELKTARTAVLYREYGWIPGETIVEYHGIRLLMVGTDELGNIACGQVLNKCGEPTKSTRYVYNPQNAVVIGRKIKTAALL